MGTFCQISPQLQTLFRQNGLDDFEALMRAPVGELVSRDAAGRELRRITLAGGREEARFYLKGIGRESLRLALRLLFFAAIWPTNLFRLYVGK